MARKLPVWCKSAKIAMIKQDINTDELAEGIGLQRPYVSSILNGRVNSPIAKKKISEFLQISDAES